MFRCVFCGLQSEREEAIDAGWIPSFWNGDREIGATVCVQCVAAGRVVFNEEMGDYDTPEFVPNMDELMKSQG